MSGHIITNLALDAFTEDELTLLRLAARMLPYGHSGIVILPDRPETYAVTRIKEGMTLELVGANTPRRGPSGPA